MKALILNGSPRPQGVVVQALRTAADTLRQAGADIESVSYTHLDVYKRQDLCRGDLFMSQHLGNC